MLTSQTKKQIRFVVSFLIIILFNLVNNIVQAQENTQSEVTNQLWIDVNPSYRISGKFDLHGRLGAKAVFPYESRSRIGFAELVNSVPRSSAAWVSEHK